MNCPIFQSSVWQLRSCPKCGGDRNLEITVESLDLVCVQCGHRTDATPSRMPVRGRPFKSKFMQQKEPAGKIY